MTPAERTAAARALNGNPLLEECFDKFISQCFEVWLGDPNKESRELLWHRVKAIQLVRVDINGAVKSALRDGQQQQSIDV